MLDLLQTLKDIRAGESVESVESVETVECPTCQRCTLARLSRLWPFVLTGKIAEAIPGSGRQVTAGSGVAGLGKSQVRKSQASGLRGDGGEEEHKVRKSPSVRMEPGGRSKVAGVRGMEPGGRS